MQKRCLQHWVARVGRKKTKRLSQLSPRPHTRHLMVKRTTEWATIKNITSDKREGKTHTQKFTKDTHIISIEQLKIGGHSATLVENSSNIYFTYFSIFNFITEENRKHNGQLCFSWPYCWNPYTSRHNMQHLETTTEVPPLKGQ